MSWQNTAVRCSPPSLLCTGPEALKNSSNDTSADTEIKHGHLKIWHNYCLSKPQRLLPVSAQRISDMTFKKHKRDALNYNVLLTQLKQSDSP